MYLVEVDDGLPEGVGLLVEVPHTNLTEVTGMVLFVPFCQSRVLKMCVRRRWLIASLSREGIARTLSMLVRWWC